MRMERTVPNEGRKCHRVEHVFPSPMFEVGCTRDNTCHNVSQYFSIQHLTSNQAVYKELVYDIGMCDRTPSLEQHIEHLIILDPSLNKFQPGSGSNTNTNTTTKASARKIDSKKGDTTGTASSGKDNSLTCYSCSKVGYLSPNYPISDLLTKLLE